MLSLQIFVICKVCVSAKQNTKGLSAHMQLPIKNILCHGVAFIISYCATPLIYFLRFQMGRGNSDLRIENFVNNTVVWT